MSLKHAILGLLLDGPLHGYGLKGLYEKELVPGSTVNIGQIYQALDKLEAEGLVRSEVVPQAERPDRKDYTLQEKGRGELRNWLRSPSERGLEIRNESFLKLMLAWRTSLRPECGVRVEPLSVLDAERRVCLAGLHDLTATRARFEEGGTSLPVLALLELGIQRMTAFHHWLDRCEELLRSSGRAGPTGTAEGKQS